MKDQFHKWNFAVDFVEEMLNSLESAPGLARASGDPSMSFLCPHRCGETVGVSQNEGCQEAIGELGGSIITIDDDATLLNHYISSRIHTFGDTPMCCLG